jgi:hypothetical protein
MYYQNGSFPLVNRDVMMSLNVVTHHVVGAMGDHDEGCE